VKDNGKPKRIAFGAMPFWEQAIRDNLAPRYQPSFVDLAEVDPDDYDAVVPLQLMHYAPLERFADLLGRKFLHPSAATVALCDDKRALAEFLIANGFGDHVPQLRSAGPPYPYVWKRRRGWWGEHTYIVKNPADEEALDLKDSDWFAQQVIPGNVEFATHLLRVGGAIKYVSTFVHLMASPLVVQGARQVALRSTLVRGCEHLAVFSAMLERLGFAGTACIDYKIVDGKPVVFEINPRFGASLCADVTAYVDAYVGALAPLSLRQRAAIEVRKLRRQLARRL
jgi:predicted ATP-grasp superfamily ATP-dependent carboligase